MSGERRWMVTVLERRWVMYQALATDLGAVHEMVRKGCRGVGDAK